MYMAGCRALGVDVDSELYGLNGLFVKDDTVEGKGFPLLP